MVNMAPGGILLIAAITSAPGSEMQDFFISINLDAIYSMVVAIAFLWAASYIGTAIAMRHIKKYGKQ